MADPIEISVIIGAKNARATIETCLQSIISQTGKHSIEIIVVDGSSDGTADLVEAQFPTMQLVRAAASTLVPLLWRFGLDQAQGRIVAFTNANLAPEPDWLDQISGMDWGQFSAVGGPLIGPLDGKAADWALYFSRYSSYLPSGVPSEATDLAGDNAAYRLAVLRNYQSGLVDGFWEHNVHGWMLSDGHRLQLNPGLKVRLLPGTRLGESFRMRYDHGKIYASMRSGTAVVRVFRAFATPILPAVLLLRMAGRVYRQKPAWVPNFIRALPALTALVIAWSAGEAAGYLGSIRGVKGA